MTFLSAGAPALPRQQQGEDERPSGNELENAQGVPTRIGVRGSQWWAIGRSIRRRRLGDGRIGEAVRPGGGRRDNRGRRRRNGRNLSLRPGSAVRRRRR